MNKKHYTIILLIIITLAIFIQTLSFEFVAWDDNMHVYENPYMNPVTSGSFLHFWKKPHDFALTYTLWAIQAKQSKLSIIKDEYQIQFSPYLFHLSNLIIHLLSVLIVFSILKILVKNNWAACTGAVLFAIHPVQVEPIAWITGLKDVLSGFFSFAAVWQFLLFRKIKTSPHSGTDKQDTNLSGQKLKISRKYFHYILATLAFILAMISKPTAVVVPAVVFLLDHLILKHQLKQNLPAILFWLVLAIPMAVLAKAAQPDTLIEYVTPILKRPLIFTDTIVFYLNKLIMPITLGVDYGRTPEFVLKQGYIYFIWLIPFGLALLLWRWRKKKPWLLASAGIFIASILPVSGLIPFAFQNISTVADRYLYFAILGPALALSFFIFHYRKKKIIKITVILFLAIIGMRSIFQAQYWKNTSALFSHALEVNPDSFAAYNNLGNDFKRKGAIIEAGRHYKEALKFKPYSDNAHNNLGLVLADLGRNKEAVPHYLQALKSNPNYFKAHFNLGITLEKLGKINDATFHYLEAVKIEPLFAQPYNNLGIIYARQRKFKESIKYFSQAIKIKPNFAKAEFNLGNIFTMQGNYNKAIIQYTEALRINPSYAEAHNNLGSVLEQNGRISEAISHFSAALRIFPQYKDAQNNLNRVLKKQ